jgi:integrase
VQGLREVKPLMMGDDRSFDKPKRSLVTEDEFQKLLAELGGVIGDMCQLMWYTAMRPYEVCEMRPFDILTDESDCWLYIPGRDQSPVGGHKTTRFERVKVIPLTRKSQDILKPRIVDWNAKQFIFSPKEAMAEFLKKKAENRKTPLNAGNRPGTNRKEHPMIVPGDHYNTSTLEHAMARACNRAGVEKIRPYDLRRTMATGTRAILGKEAAKLLLGHVSTDTTEIYLLDEVKESMKVAKQLDASQEATREAESPAEES